MEKAGLNVLFILPEYYPHSGGGISTYYLNYIKALKPSINKIKVIVGSGYTQSDEKFSQDYISIEYLKPSLFIKYLLLFKSYDIIPVFQRNLAAAWAMWEQSNQGQGYDIIECTDFGLGYIPWAILHNKPLVTRLHGSSGQIEINEPETKDKFFGDINRCTELAVLSKSDTIITHSKANQQYWQSLLPNKEIKLIYPVYIREHTDFEIVEKTNDAIVCGRIQQWKGPEVLCKALEILNKNKLIINWYGRDTKYNSNTSMNAYLSNAYPKIWGKQIRIMSPLPNKELLEVQKKVLFGIIPSNWDMFNFTCLEYLSAGIPVICSKNAGASDLIENSINGYIYSDNNSSELSNKIEAMLKLSKIDYSEMCKAAYNTIQTKLAMDKVLPLNVDIYKCLLQNFKICHNNVYLNLMYTPKYSPSALTTSLDQHPLKNILKYSLNRLLRKFNI